MDRVLPLFSIPAWTLTSLAAGVLLIPGCAPDGIEDPEEGAFVVRLGTDTTAVERYTLSPDRMEVRAVTRSPRTLLRNATLEFDDQGGLVRYESRVEDPAAPEEERLVDRTRITYEGDSATVERGVNGETETVRVAAGSHMVPLSFNHFSLTELAIRRGLEAGRDTVQLLSGGPWPMALQRIPPDSVALETDQLGTWLARVDSEGRILGMAAGALGRDVERASGLDVDALADRFADEDARGVGMGPLSPRDTTRATVRGAEILVDYSRPAKRGRQVFGGLVPYGEIWRTGADLATHLITDRPLRIGGERLPAGTYTLFTIPRPEEWTLIVNEETGQAGTQYDEDRDVVRETMRTFALDPPVERFTIAVEEDGNGGLLRLQWTDTEARIPFQVESGSGT